MIDVNLEFPDRKIGSYFSPPSYREIVSKLGKIEIEASDDDYQGDSYFLLSKSNQVGYLSLSWGSCSGCDALQACESYSDLQELVDKLESSIVWFDSLKQIQNWINSRDWEVTSEYHTGVREFLKEFREYHLRTFK